MSNDLAGRFWQALHPELQRLADEGASRVDVIEGLLKVCAQLGEDNEMTRNVFVVGADKAWSSLDRLVDDASVFRTDGECDVCAGTGIEPPHDACRSCNGSGSGASRGGN